MHESMTSPYLCKSSFHCPCVPVTPLPFHNSFIHLLSILLSLPPSQTIVAEGGSFNSRSLGLRIQKKLAGKLSNKSMAKQFIDDEMGVLLDTINIILRKETGDNKKADKIITNMIKITVKLGLLYKNSQFSSEEIELGMKFRTKLRQAALTVISFHEVDFTYDRGFLVKTVNDCGDILHKLVERHLTNKSHQRITSIITAFSSPELLDKVFLPEGAYHEHLESVAHGFHRVVDSEW